MFTKMNTRFSRKLKCLFLFGLMLCCSNFVTAQESSHSVADNNWSEHVPQYEIRFRPIDATCFNNAHMLYAVVDKNNPDIPLDTTTLRLAGLDEIRIYHAQTELDTTKHRSAFYKGGWDTLTLDYGTYVFGVEAVMREGIGEGLDYVVVDTNTVLSIGTSYSMPKAAAMSVSAFSRDALGNLPTLACMPTGRVQLRIEDGAFPYTITVHPHDNPDSVFKTVTFDDRMYSGNDEWRYDYKDYYTIDSLPAGDWDFYLEDGCGSGLPRTGAIVETVQVPNLHDIEVYAASGNPHYNQLAPYDSNVIRINAELDMPYYPYLDSLAKYMSYRIYLDTLDNSQHVAWDPYPQPLKVKTTLYDTIVGLKYCDFYGNTIVFEYKFDMPACTTFSVKDTFHYYKPNEKWFEKRSEYVIDSASTVDSCGRIWYSHRDYYAIRYRSYEPDFVNGTIDDDNLYRRYHFTFPVYWYYYDEDNNVIKIDTLRDIYQNIAATSKLTYEEAYAYFQPENPSFSRRVRRQLVGAKGCELYETEDMMYFDRKVQSEAPSWSLSTHASGHCCEIPRTITLTESHGSEYDMDSVVIELVTSPYDNLYNFKAVYDGTTHTWEVEKYNFENTMEVIGASDGRSMELSAYCMPGGPYRFVVTTPCGQYAVNRDIEFPEIYRTRLTAEPRFAVHAECSDEYIRCTQGKVVRMAFSRDPHTGVERTRIDSLTTYYEIVDGPPGGYSTSDHTKYMLKDSIRISMPGRYILRVYPDHSEELCEDYEYFDTIYYDGNSVEFDYALALLCDENTTSGTAYVKARKGTPPYAYTLYSEKDLGGIALAHDTLDGNQVFVVPDTVFVNAGVELSPQRELSCLVQDACGSYFRINFYPQVLADLQKTWFNGGLKADTTCEGATIQIHALHVSEIFTYQWTGPDGFYSESSDPYLFIERGSGVGYYKVTIRGTGCPSDISDSIFLGVKPSPTVTISPMGEVCPGEEVELKVVPHVGIDTLANLKVNFTVALDNGTNVYTRSFDSVTSGDTVRFTYIPTSETKIYPQSIVDAECGYHYADPGDTVVLRMSGRSVTPCNIITTPDTVCYGGTGHLTATLNLEGRPVSEKFPTHVRWYGDYEMHHLLSDTVIRGDVSMYDTAGLTKRTILYVSVNQEDMCPSTIGIPNNATNMVHGDTTRMNCADVIRFYDPGGPDGTYPVGTASKQVFTSVDGRPVALHFESLNLATPSYLYVFSGTTVHQDSLLYFFGYGSTPPELIVSRSNSMTVYFSPGPLTSDGWSAIVSPAPGMAIADVWPHNEVFFSDELCYVEGVPYTPPFSGWESVVSRELLDDRLQHPGTYTFVSHFQDIHDCDSSVVFMLRVNSAPLRGDTTVVILDNTGGFRWHDRVYTETGQYTYSVSGATAPSGCDSVDRLNLIVLKVDTSDNEICVGETTQLHVQVHTPNIVGSFDIPSMVGDVVCQRVVQSEEGSYTKTEILRPDSFLLHADDEGLIPMGVVFFVDPADNAHGLAIALVDAHDTCIWASDSRITNTQPLGGTGTKQHYMALFDMKGNEHTKDILQSAKNLLLAGYLVGTEAEVAPAAYYCHYYDHVTQTTGSTHLAYPDWYMPSTGETCLYLSERLVVNSTLQKIGDYLESSGSAYRAEIPFDGLCTDTGYWTSTEYNAETAGHINQKGQLRNHKKDGSASSGWRRVIKYVRAIFAY